jgi:hypothetical protein
MAQQLLDHPKSALRMLRDTLEPVYEAASRYALEFVFGRKPEPRTHPQRW